MRRWVVTAALLAGTAAAQQPVPKEPVEKVPEALDKPGANLRKRIERLLAQGKLEEALKAAQEAALGKASAGERKEFADLHLSIARQLMRVDDFRRAEQLARKVIDGDPENADARGLLADLDRARAQAPPMVERAQQFLAVERFGSASRILHKALALLPEREPQWKPILLRAHLGAADQHYRLSNWAEAVFHYDAASTELDEAGRRRQLHAVVFQTESLLKRGRISEPALGPLLKTAINELQKRPDPAVSTMLAGIAAENAGKFDEAIGHYCATAGAAKPAKNGAAEAASLRFAAVSALRKTMPKLGPEFRARMWQESLPGEWLVRETNRFVIHHHNDRIARHIADALEFHFVELLNDWDFPLQKMAGWKPKVHVYVHRNEKEFRAETGIETFVPAFSKKPKPGAPLTEHSIHCYQNHPGLLSSILPHELTHLMLAYAMDYPAMATALDEGLALSGEPDYMRLAYRRIALERRGREAPPTIAQLLAGTDFKNAGETTVFYARSMVLADFLRSRIAPDKLLELIPRMAAGDPRPLMAAAMGLKTTEELEEAWKATIGGN